MSMKVDYAWRTAAQRVDSTRRMKRSERRRNGSFEPLEDRVVPTGWADSYANWFNSTFGSGYSQTVGGWLYNGATAAGVPNQTLSNASDGALLTGTAVVAVPTGIAIVAGGELVLGVGSLGGVTAVATGAAETAAAVEAATSAGEAAVAASHGALLGAEAEIVTTYTEIIEANYAIASLQAIETQLAAGAASSPLAQNVLVTVQAEIATLQQQVQLNWTWIDLLL